MVAESTLVERNVGAGEGSREGGVGEDDIVRSVSGAGGGEGGADGDCGQEEGAGEEGEGAQRVLWEGRERHVTE